MKCPYRKETAKLNGRAVENFGECYKSECPFYDKLVKGGNTTQITHICRRASKEGEGRYKNG